MFTSQNENAWLTKYYKTVYKYEYTHETKIIKLNKYTFILMCGYMHYIIIINPTYIICICKNMNKLISSYTSLHLL